MNNETLDNVSHNNVELTIILLQARIRGYLLRKSISDRFTHFYNNIEKVIRIQTWWREILARKYNDNLLEAEVKDDQKGEISSLKYFKKHVSFLQFQCKGIRLFVKIF